MRITSIIHHGALMGHLYDVLDDKLPLDYHVAYRQITLAFQDGGHGLRPLAQHADAAFVGQWSLSVQSGWNTSTGRSFYPILTQVLEEAAKAETVPVLRSVETSARRPSRWKSSLATAPMHFPRPRRRSKYEEFWQKGFLESMVP